MVVGTARKAMKSWNSSPSVGAEWRWRAGASDWRQEYLQEALRPQIRRCRLFLGMDGFLTKQVSANTNEV